MIESTKRVLFAISDTGVGHRSAANAIIDSLRDEKNVHCDIQDLLRATRFPGIADAPEIYDYCSKKHVWLNDMFFRRTNFVNRIKSLTSLVYLSSGRQIESVLSQLCPDAVVAVHPLVIGLLEKARRATGATWPIITVVTDLVTIHASWATPGADLYVAPTPDAKQALLRYRVPEDRIVVGGFPVHLKFLVGVPSQADARVRLGIDPNPYTVLFTGGGGGAGNMDAWIRALEQHCGDKQILVVTGRNKALYDELHACQHRSGQFHVFGFVDNMEELMAAADVIITKAGPGTIMEGAALRRPQIITGAIGIQELGNIDFARNNRLGYFCPDPIEACQLINTLAAQSKQETIPYHKVEQMLNGSKGIGQIIMKQLDAGRVAEPQQWNRNRGA